MIKRVLRVAVIVLCVYVLLGVLIPPLLRPEAEADALAIGETAGTPRVISLETNEEALQWRLQVIGEAEEEIVLSTFKWEDDTTGRAVMAALYDAAERGVHIRILIDGMNGQLRLTSSEAFHALASLENVEVRYYNPANILKPWRLNYRLHDKYIIADDTVYILGGRNVNDLSLSENEDANADRDVLVWETEPGTDTSLAQLMAYFEQVWDMDCVKAVSYHTSDEQLARGLSQLEAARMEYQTEDLETATLEADSVTLLSNPAQAWTKAPVLFESLCQVMEAGENVVIQTPYIICGRQMYQALTALASGRTVSVITNSPATGANPWGCSDILNQQKKISAAGADTYLWYGDRSSHAKTVLVDDDISIVGSYNLDMRSTYLDTELMLVIESSALNARLRELYGGLQEESLLVTAGGEELTGAACDPVSLSPGRKAVFTVLRVVMLPFRYLL
ncbi:MAG: phospholipase D family protein [Oscillospiraceae bacterium]|nr:phospholipase D family protein [Oscillospiraceae bacterium]